MSVERTVQLPHGTAVPVLGQGTWYMGEGLQDRGMERDALRAGLDLGMTLIDTAEMYGNGAAEELVGEAVSGRRDETYLVSKVLPFNASRKGTVEACHGSLRRLGTDRIDLYLLHWPGPHPLEETVEAFESLVQRGDIGAWGVSNFDVDDLTRLPPSALNSAGLQVNQILYNLTRRGPEFDLLPWLRQHRITPIAYSPIEQGRLLSHDAVTTVADSHAASPAQIALAWVLRHPGLVAIPKSGRPEHVRQNHAALRIELSEADLDLLDAAFAPPTAPVPLEIL
ncbi:aldo/keto reductase [Arthrobacter castelli]|uniref:aldo/keto reductase n=1 Tax=Arthrobacter castelli TaxID=271431 RepID=UPI0004144CD1|nr:aldo/keto reductase [Arthrobacter castelli]